MLIMRIMPPVAELVALALARTKFLDEAADAITPREIYRAATIATNQAAESWEEDAGLPIGATVPDAIRVQVAADLVAAAQAIAKNAADALRDAIEAGDVDHDGGPVPYPTYQSAA